MSASSGHGAEPNLTPILDMVFQLITFFMLVINFKGAALDLTLKLPVLGSARPLSADDKSEELMMVLNLNAEGKANVYGVEKDLKTFIPNEAKLQAMKASLANKKFKKGDELATTIVIRADKGIPFEKLNEVIKLCQEHGYRKFSLKAMNRPEGT